MFKETIEKKKTKLLSICLGNVCTKKERQSNKEREKLAESRGMFLFTPHQKMQIQICISLLSLKFKYSNPCKRGGGEILSDNDQNINWVSEWPEWTHGRGFAAFCPVHDVTSAWPFSSHYQIWLMLCFGRLMFKWGHFLLKAFYYVCFYMRTANNPESVMLHLLLFPCRSDFTACGGVFMSL